MQTDNKRWRVLRRAVAMTQPDHITEVGLLRVDGEAHRLGDGHSTRFFAEYIRENPDVEYVGFDIAPEAVALCRRLFPLPTMAFLHADAIDPVVGVSTEWPPDLLYLDGGDDPVDTVRQFIASGMVEGTIVIDDTYTICEKERPYFVGKGAGLVPLLAALGWTILPAEDYMVICTTHPSDGPASREP